MPQEWPSEDEDFDSTTDSASSAAKVATATASKPIKAEIKTEEDKPEEAAPEAAETPAEEAPQEEAPVEPEAPAEPEASSEPEQATEPEAPADVPPAAPAKVKKPKNPKNWGGILRIAAEALLLIAVVFLAFWAWNLSTDNANLQKQVTELNANPQATVQKQTDALIAKIGALINLPADETPTIANVTDAAAAKKQSAFFNNAQNGDKVLMYVKAGQAILYRPSTNKIILVAPLNFTNTAATTKK